MVKYSILVPASAIATSVALSGLTYRKPTVSASALKSVIGVFHRDPSTTVEALTVAFTSDYSQFAKANNREPLNRASESLNKSRADKAIAEAIIAGYKAGKLVTGYVGAHSGPFSKQPEEVQATFMDAIASASAAFASALEFSGAFVTKSPKTEEEKAKAKAKAKAEEVITKAINDKIQAGELFHADSVGSAVTLGQLSSLALIDELAHRNLTEAEACHLEEVFGLDLSRKSLIEAQRLEGEARAEATALAEELAKAKVSKAKVSKVKAKAEAIA